MIWFTADTHFMHESILRANPDLIDHDRPWDNIEEHDEALIANWNSLVHPKHTVYHLGDFALGKGNKKILKCRYQIILHRLNGKKHLVAGNHDTKEIRELEGWESVSDLLKIKVGDQKVILCHYPMEAWDASHYESWHLHGHMHNQLKKTRYRYSLDVGVDAHDFRPTPFDEVAAHFTHIKFKRLTELERN